MPFLLQDPCLTLAIDKFVGSGSELDLLSIGRLAVSSKEIHATVAGLPLWKKLYKLFTDVAVKGYENGGVNVPAGYMGALQSYSGEQGLPTIFLSESLSASVNGSWMPACRMLLSHSCQFCGKMCGEANALAVARACKSCYKTKEELWMVCASKAKEVSGLRANAVVRINTVSLCYPTTRHSCSQTRT